MNSTAALARQAGMTDAEWTAAVKFDSTDWGWIIMSIGMAIGAGIVFLPVQVGLVGIWVYLFSAIIAYPASYLLPREEVTLWRNVDYFLIDANSNVYLANQRGFKKVFPKRRKEIEERVRQGYREHDRIKFSDGADVRELFSFCIRNQ